MLLAADIGNTSITLGLFQGKKLVQSWRLASDTRKSIDEHVMLLTQLLGKRRRAVRTFALACVVPPLEANLAAASRALFGREPVVVNHSSVLGFRIGYSPPGDVGADRLANAAAAIERHGAPVIVVDFGTAVTVDVVDRRRIYLGGAIAPGLELAADTLFRRTARLPLVDLKAPENAIGRNTFDSIRSGLVLGCAAQVDGLLSLMIRELGGRPHVIATGGSAHLVTPYLKLVDKEEPDLTLEGIRLVAERNPGTAGNRRRARGRRG